MSIWEKNSGVCENDRELVLVDGERVQESSYDHKA